MLKQLTQPNKNEDRGYITDFRKMFCGQKQNLFILGDISRTFGGYIGTVKLTQTGQNTPVLGKSRRKEAVGLLPSKLHGHLQKRLFVQGLS